MKYLLIFNFHDPYGEDEPYDGSVEKEIECKPHELKEKISKLKEDVKNQVSGKNAVGPSTISVSLTQTLPLE